MAGLAAIGLQRGNLCFAREDMIRYDVPGMTRLWVLNDDEIRCITSRGESMKFFQVGPAHVFTPAQAELKLLRLKRKMRNKENR